MSDAKTEYRTHVWSQKKNAFFNSEIAKKISNGMTRSAKYKDKWEAVNINSFVEKFTPDPIISVDKGKITFTSKDGKTAIIADLGGTYCRLADMTNPNKPFYLDINGKDPRNYKDAKGKQHGRSKSERQEITHFRIKKWHEMEKQMPAIIYQRSNRSMERQNEKHSCFCITFLNEEGVKEMQEYQFDNYTSNMYVEELSYDEANSIYLPVLDKYNQTFDLLIDFFEEEDLPNEKLTDAKQILDDFLSGNISKIEKSAALKVKNVIEKAIELKTYVCFEF